MASDVWSTVQNAGWPMTDRRAWNSNLAAPTKPIARHTPLRNRGGSMFKLTDDDIALWWWLGELAKGQPRRCDGCGAWRYLFRCHLLAKGSGGRVIDNIVLLDIACHEQQEKRTALYEAEHDVDLYAKARGHTAQWRKETERAL